jgi:penicillin-binding protein 2
MKPTLLKEYLDGEGNVTRTFGPTMLYDITDDITDDLYDTVIVQPWVLKLVQQGMRLAVTNGTATDYAQIENIPTAGKTGTAEYCDDIAQSRNLCKREAWPTHAWYGAFAPYDNPEIVVVAFVYDGGEGAVTAGPVVRDVLKTYFALKTIDLEQDR